MNHWIIKAAARLDMLYSNPQVVAFNRQREASTAAGGKFWQQVATALHKPYKCQMWLQDEADCWQAIRAEQERIA